MKSRPSLRLASTIGENRFVADFLVSVSAVRWRAHRRLFVTDRRPSDFGPGLGTQDSGKGVFRIFGSYDCVIRSIRNCFEPVVMVSMRLSAAENLACCSCRLDLGWHISSADAPN